MFTLIEKYRGIRCWKQRPWWCCHGQPMHANIQAHMHATRTHKGTETYSAYTLRTTFHAKHITSTHRYTLASSQDNLYPLALHFAVSLCMKSGSQLWRALHIEREGINKQANCGTHSPHCCEQGNTFYHGYWQTLCFLSCRIKLHAISLKAQNILKRHPTLFLANDEPWISSVKIKRYLQKRKVEVIVYVSSRMCTSMFSVSDVW